MIHSKLYTTQEVAKILGISRIAVFKKVKSGELKARKVGRRLMISEEDLPVAFTGTLTNADKSAIEHSVRKTVQEYAQTLKLLGQE